MLGSAIAQVIFSGLPSPRNREVVSAVSHYIAGVLDKKSFQTLINDLGNISDLAPGDPVKTLRGSLTGTVLEICRDGRIRWRTSTGSELLATADSIIKILPPKGDSA